MKTSFTISVTTTKFQAVALKDQLHENIQKVAAWGFDGVEIAARDPELIDLTKLKESLSENGIRVSALGTGQAFNDEKLSFCDKSVVTRQRAIERIKSQIDFATQIENPIVIIGLIRGIARETVSLNQAWQYMTEAVRECADYAGDKGIVLAVEPINRYETNLVNTIAEGNKLLSEVGKENVGLLVDTFHMNIEESNIIQNLGCAAKKMVHFHIADSNRWAPGCGHINFKEIIEFLKGIKYEGFISAEILPKPNPEEAIALTAAFMQKSLRK